MLCFDTTQPCPTLWGHLWAPDVKISKKSVQPGFLAKNNSTCWYHSQKYRCFVDFRCLDLTFQHLECIFGTVNVRLLVGDLTRKLLHFCFKFHFLCSKKLHHWNFQFRFVFCCFQGTWSKRVLFLSSEPQVTKVEEYQSCKGGLEMEPFSCENPPQLCWFSSNRGFDVLRRSQICFNPKCQKQKPWCMQYEYLNIFHLQTSNIDN